MSKHIHHLQAQDIIVYVDGYWLRNYASDFFNAAISYKNESNRFSPVPYYLLCHSIELSFKSFLFTVGYKRKDRKKINHDLYKALDISEKAGLNAHIDITQDDRELISNVNNLYEKKQFEYYENLKVVYDPIKVDIEELASFARRLLEAIEKPVRESICR